MTYATIHVFRFALVSLVLAVSFVFFVTPETARAYFTTSQSAVAVDGETSAVFLIEYRFGNGKHDLHMPIIAERGTERTDSVLSYEILDTAGKPAPGTAMGIVLSDAPIGAGEYVVQKGFAKRFTLLVVFKPETVSESEYRLQVTQLPFTFDGTQALQLNPSELTYYTTPPLTLGN